MGWHTLLAKATHAEMQFACRTVDGGRRSLGKSAELIAKSVLRLLIFLPGTIRMVRALSAVDCPVLQAQNAGVYLKHLRKAYACNLTTGERARMIAHHYSVVRERLGLSFLNHSIEDEVPVWSADDDPQGPRIVAKTANQYDFEGELNLQFFMGPNLLYIMSFIVSPGAIWGRDEPSVIVVTRVQGIRLYLKEMKAATAISGDCGPRLLLFAALEGLAISMGVQQIIGMGVRMQIATSFGPIKSPSFLENYDLFWRSLNGQFRLDGNFNLTAPSLHKSLENIPSKHRTRSLRRRIYRDLTMRSVLQTFRK